MVTILDVLVAVHRALRAKATYIYSNTHHGTESVLFQDPRLHNVMRVDEGAVRASVMMILGSRATWQGLSPSMVEADVWLLHVG